MAPYSMSKEHSSSADEDTEENDCKTGVNHLPPLHPPDGDSYSTASHPSSSSPQPLPIIFSSTVHKGERPAGLTLSPYKSDIGDKNGRGGGSDYSGGSSKKRQQSRVRQRPTSQSPAKMPSSSGGRGGGSSGVVITAISPQSPFHRPSNSSDTPNSDDKCINNPNPSNNNDNNGLRIGDEVLFVNGQRVKDPRRAAKLIKGTTSGYLTLIVSRNPVTNYGEGGRRMAGTIYHLARVDENDGNDNNNGSSLMVENCIDDPEPPDVNECRQSNPQAPPRLAGGEMRSRWQECKGGGGNERTDGGGSFLSSSMITENDTTKIVCGVEFETTNNGTLVRVKSLEGSCPFVDTGLRVGDVVLSINGRAVRSRRDAERMLSSSTMEDDDRGGGGRAVAILAYSLCDMRKRVLGDKLKLDDWEVSWSYEGQEEEDCNGEYVVLRVPNTTITFKLDFDSDGTCSCKDPYGALKVSMEEVEEGLEESGRSFASDSTRRAFEFLYRKHVLPLVDTINHRTWKQIRLLVDALAASSVSGSSGGGDGATEERHQQEESEEEEESEDFEALDFEAQLGKLHIPPADGPSGQQQRTEGKLQRSHASIIPLHEGIPAAIPSHHASMIPVVEGRAPQQRRRRAPARIQRKPSFVPAFAPPLSKRMSALTTFSESESSSDDSTTTDSASSTDSSEGGNEAARRGQRRRGGAMAQSPMAQPSPRGQRQVTTTSRSPLRPPPPERSNSTALVVYDPEAANRQKPKPLVRRLKMRNGDIRHRYKVFPHIIGQGAFGTVRSCLSRNTKDSRNTKEKLAVKSILKRGNVKNAKLLKNEIALVQHINHRNIVRVVDVIQDKEYIHIVMEECKGGDLFDRIVEGGVILSEKRAAEIIGSLLDAICYLHERDIVHRDLKAEHIMLSSDDINSPVKIIDFGLATTHGSDDPPMTAFAGSAFTVAPEVIKRSYGKECDLWSVGVVTYFLLTQRMPFNAPSDKDIFQKIGAGVYGYPQWTEKGLSNEAKDFIDRLLVVDPKRRLTARQALSHLWVRKHNPKLAESITMASQQELALVPVVVEENSIVVRNKPKLEPMERMAPVMYEQERRRRRENRAANNIRNNTNNPARRSPVRPPAAAAGKAHRRPQAHEARQVRRSIDP